MFNITFAHLSQEPEGVFQQFNYFDFHVYWIWSLLRMKFHPQTQSSDAMAHFWQTSCCYYPLISHFKAFVVKPIKGFYETEI